MPSSRNRKSDTKFSAIPAVPDGPPEKMNCMEVWGGNKTVAKSFRMPGLRLCLVSQTHENAESGGDVYYISSCASGRITRLMLADVCGHGQLAAGQANALRDLIRKNVNVIKQYKLVAEINQRFRELSRENSFATALLCTHFAPNHSISLSNAGHPPPLFYDSKSAKWSLLHDELPDSSSIVNTPLGIIKDASYPHIERRLSPDDVILFYSDALSEACDDDGIQIGVEGLQAIVEELDASRPERLVQGLLEKIESLNPENLQNDDLTILAIQSEKTKSTLKDNLVAPFRLLRNVKDRTSIVHTIGQD
jgi:sigma-B regulation protein RsbU (phosphoserine phosphatase)